MREPLVECINHGMEAIALIIRAAYDKPGIQFFTPAPFSQQLALMTHPAGHKIAAHVHNLVARQVLYTQEVLIVRRGCIQVHLYASDRTRIGDRILRDGDVILLCGGGHAIEILEETSMIEVKQGPYTGESDKTVFQEGGTLP
jgi:hypothetical protein